ncbi:MAG: hypothetical protein ACXWU2_08765 [Allosphingosinicella sp.]
MKAVAIAAAIASQIASAAQPALAAELTDTQSRQMGTFGGVRLRLPLDGDDRQRRLRATLTLAPTMQSRTLSGETRSRIGEGLELGFAGTGPVRLTLAGMRLDRLGAAQTEQDEEESGIPTWALITGGVVVALGAGYLWFEDAMNDSND